MPTVTTTKGYKGLAMEGPIAGWYAGSTGKNTRRQEATARLIAGRIPKGAAVLEIAPGPGYFAIALARLGDVAVTGLDISRSFVEIAQHKAAAAGLAITFRQGNASAMPFDDGVFDATSCQAAFKNFSDPVGALREMHRVLRPGGFAHIQDLRRDATPEGIAREVAQMRLGRLDRWFTRWTFDHMLLKSAYSLAAMEAMVAQTPFRTGEFVVDDIGFDLYLRKTA